MARVARLAGALLLETRPPIPLGSPAPEWQYYLIGNTKEPCDFPAEGFEAPGEIDAVRQPYVRLSPTRTLTITLRPPWLHMSVEGKVAAELLAARLLINRNGAVSDRLWRIITNPDAPEEETTAQRVPAHWLADIPGPIWEIVRDSVLRCS
jgi:hypothetical protein